MAHRKFTDEMRDMCENWNLSRDAALLEHLENLSKTITEESEGILQSVKEIEFDVNRTAISVSTSRNSLQVLSDTQFIENKIEEIEELDISENSEKFRSHSKQEAIASPPSTDCTRISILAGVKIIDDNFEVIPIPKNDSDSEDDDEEVILKARNKFLSRPTPHLIGSTDFFRDNTVGILELSSQEESEDEMSSPKSPGSINEDIPSLSQFTDPTPTTPSISYPTPLYRPVEITQTGPSLTPSFQDQLSAKLQSTSQNEPSDIHRIIGKTGPPQLFPSSGSTSEDENSSLFDHTPPSSKQTLSESVLPTSSITQENPPTRSVDPPSESENVPPKKQMGGNSQKSITSSLLNEMLSKNILQNNAIKKEQPKNDPESVKVEPKAVSPELFENTDSFLPKPPQRTQTSQKSVKSSLAKSLFESSSDEDEPAPQWIPDNSSNQERFHSDIKNIQGNSYSEKVPPPYIPSLVTSVDNVDNAAIVNKNVPLDQEKIAPVDKYKSNLAKVLPDITNHKPLKKSLPTENTQQAEQSSGNKVVENSKKEAKPNSKSKTKVTSIFDESDEEIIDYPKTSKTTQPPSNVMSKPDQKPISNQGKKKIVSLFDDDSDDDIMNEPPKTVTKKQPEPELKSEITRNEKIIPQANKTNQQTTKEINHNNFDNANNDDIFSELPPTKPKNSTSSNPKTKPVVSLFSDSDSEDDLFAIPKSNRASKSYESDVKDEDLFGISKPNRGNSQPKDSGMKNDIKPKTEIKSTNSGGKDHDDLFANPIPKIASKPSVKEDGVIATPKPKHESISAVKDEDLFGISKPNRESSQPKDSSMKNDIKPKPEIKPTNSGVKDDDLFAIPKPNLESKPTASAVKEDGVFATPKVKHESISAVKDEDLSEIPKVSGTKPMDEDELFSTPKQKAETKHSDSIIEEDDLFAVSKPNFGTNSAVNKTNPEKPSQIFFNDSRSDIFDEIDREANSKPSPSDIIQTNESEVLNAPNKIAKVVDLKEEPSITSKETTLKTSVIRNSSLNLFSDDNSDEPENVTCSPSNTEVKSLPRCVTPKNLLDADFNLVEKISEKELPSQNSSENISGLPKDVNIRSTAVTKPNEKDDEMFKEEINFMKETPPPFPKSKDELDLFSKDKKNTIDLFNTNDSDNSDNDLWDNIPSSKTTPRNNEKIIEPLPNEDSTRSKLPSKQQKVLENEESSKSKLEIPLNKDSGDVLRDQTNKDRSEKYLVADTKSTDVADPKKSLDLLENNQPQTDVTVDEEKSIASNKVLSLVNSFPLSSESEPSSPLFPEDKSVRSVKVTTEAKIITKTNKDNPDGLVSSVVKKPEKLPARMKLNINLAGLVPGQNFTKKTIDSLKNINDEINQEKTPEDLPESDITPDLLSSTASDISPQSDLTSPETSTGFLPSLTKGRPKIINKRKPPSKRISMKSADLSQDKIDSVPTIEPSNKETPKNFSESAIPTQISNEPVVSKSNENERRSSIETKNAIVKSTNENQIQGSSETKNTTVKPSTNEKNSLPKANSSILEDNFLDEKKISIFDFDNSDDEDDIFNEIAAKKSQMSSTKSSSSHVKKSEVSKITVNKPASTEIQISSKSTSKPTDDLNVSTAIETTVKDSKHENISNPEVIPVEAKIKPLQTRPNNSLNANSSKTLFSNANKLKKNTILFNDENDDDDDDLFGPISKAQNTSTRKISNASSDKEIVIKSTENVNKPNVDKPVTKYDDNVDKPMKSSETKIEQRQDILNRESKKADDDKPPAKSSDKPLAKSSDKPLAKSEVNNVSNSKPSANSSSSTRKTNSKKNTLFGDDDSDEDLFESLNKSKTKDNNNKVDNNGKLFNDNQSDDDDLFKISSKDVSSSSKKNLTSSKKTVPQTRTQEHLNDPLSKF